METFATEIFSLIKLNISPEYGRAAVLSIPYMLLAMGLIGLYHYFTKKREKYVTVSGAGSRGDRIDLGRSRFLGAGYCVLVWAGSFAIPAIGIAGMALSPQLGSAFEGVTLGNFAAFFELSKIQPVLINTIIFAFLGAVGVVVVATLISYTALKYDHRLARIGDYASTIPLGLPPIVYGLSIFWMILLVPGFNSLHGTIVPLVLAIIFMKTPHGVRIISSNLIQISDEFEEASRVSGWSWFQSFRKIVIPLSLDGIGNAFLFVFIDSMKELAGVVLLITAGSDVFTNYIMQLYGNDPSALPTIAAGAVIFTGFILVFVFIQTKLQGYSASRKFLY
jgi:iron(III) transport system permease protein